ncbi:ATP synthase-coupling factor 6, mitochondrial [Ischnura elegans]|uniref:ATP synthase-coupling factor 6, mitochondrial n=1 Tax=Ischnura elegans TaxID=197161 RepID=UPI001ED87117|nr:ATP synthase-coupling factor 6, mitochondrial [Ischnura elegans]
MLRWHYDISILPVAILCRRRRQNSKMLTQVLINLRSQAPVLLRRNIGICAPALQKVSDPIQQLFLDKIRDYAKKSKATGGKLVEPSPEIERELKAELDKVTMQYGGASGEDMTKFPTFKFQDPKVDPI